MSPLKSSCNDVLGDKLNTLLDTVYEMNDASQGVSDDLENLISSTVQQVEEITDKIQDALKEVLGLFEEAKTNENAWRKPETYPTSCLLYTSDAADE